MAQLCSILFDVGLGRHWWLQRFQGPWTPPKYHSSVCFFCLILALLFFLICFDNIALCVLSLHPRRSCIKIWMMGFCQGSSVGAELRDFSAAFLQHNSMDSKSRKVVRIFVFKLLSTLEWNVWESMCFQFVCFLRTSFLLASPWFGIENWANTARWSEPKSNASECCISKCQHSCYAIWNQLFFSPRGSCRRSSCRHGFHHLQLAVSTCMQIHQENCLGVLHATRC